MSLRTCAGTAARPFVVLAVLAMSASLALATRPAEAQNVVGTGELRVCPASPPHNAPSGTVSVKATSDPNRFRVEVDLSQATEQLNQALAAYSGATSWMVWADGETADNVMVGALGEDMKLVKEIEFGPCYFYLLPHGAEGTQETPNNVVSMLTLAGCDAVFYGEVNWSAGVEKPNCDSKIFGPAWGKGFASSTPPGMPKTGTTSPFPIALELVALVLLLLGLPLRLARRRYR